MNIISRFQNKKTPKQASLKVGVMKPKPGFEKKVLFITQLGGLLILTLCYWLPLQAQNPNAAQWKSVGGQKIMSGNHSFTTSWSSSPQSREKGLYWKGYWGEPNPNYQPWDPVVAKSVAPKKGQFTVQGPGHIGLYYKAKGASIVMHIADTKEVFHPCSIGKNFNPKGEFWGRIPDGKEITIVVEAHMSAYNNMMNTGEYAFHAPQEITEFEIWFFPGNGGKVISTTHQTGHVDKPKPGILYYTEKKCH